MAETDGPGAAVAPNDTVWPGNLLDAANRAIIEALQRDGRQPYGGHRRGGGPLGGGCPPTGPATA